MIPPECKRLAEVDFPIAAVSRHAAREKSIRHGHPSTLHLWWARRPLASSRAVLLALLLPDPCDPACPEAFAAQAPEILTAVRQRPNDAAELRKALLWFIGSFANWSLAADPTYLRVARDLVRAAHPGEAPLVVDPFAGGGSIPLEALRVGCETFASDLNPVACLILKVMLEEIPRHGPGLAEELRRVGGEVKAAAEKELAGLYPPDPDGATPIAYLWARTVRCEAPACGAEIPLLRSFWLCRKPKRRRALRTRVVRAEGERPRVEFALFEPASDRDVPAGTVTRAKAACPCCGVVLPPERVRAQLAEQRGGADAVFDDAGWRIGGARLTAVVTLRPGEAGRHYRLPTDADYAAVRTAQARLAGILGEWERGGKQGLCPVPDEPLPLMSGTFNVPLYGMNRWGDLFTARQKMVLITVTSLIRNSTEQDTVRHLLMCALSVFARACNSNARLRPDSSIAPAFGMQALPITWTFPETVLSGGRAEYFDGSLMNVAKAVENLPSLLVFGESQQADAVDHPYPDQAAGIWFTDPPYYFAIPYADLSDFFFVWIKRALPDYLLSQGSFDPGEILTPKGPELCEMARWDPERYSHKDKNFFEDGMAAAFGEGRRVLSEDGIGSIVFAHKTTEGWEALLSGMIRGGWTITGSWPIATESAARLRARDSAVLATSIHLVCRPRSDDAPVGDWAVVLQELPERVGEWMERLQDEGVRGADLVFACIGPALEIFSRYPKVETADGDEVGLPAYLERVWEVVGRTALRTVLGEGEAKARNGLAGALEEDARLTALFLWTLQSTSADDGAAAAGNAASDESAEADETDGADETPRGKGAGYTLIFDVVRRFAQPLGIRLPDWEGRIVETAKGVVRLLPVTARETQLFGKDGIGAAASAIERDPSGDAQPLLFPDDAPAAPGPALRTGAVRRGASAVREGVVREEAETRTPDAATTLDRVHAAMLLQASGRSQALRALLKAEQDRGPDFLRLANALSALYPPAGEEKRLLDAMLLAAPR